MGRAADIVRQGLKELGWAASAADADEVTYDPTSGIDFAAGGGATFPDEWTISAGGEFEIATTTPNSGGVLVLKSAAGSTGDEMLRIATDADSPVFEVGWGDSAGLRLWAQEGNSKFVSLLEAPSLLLLKNDGGDNVVNVEDSDWITFSPFGTVQVSPQGFLVLSKDSQPATTQVFNGSFSFYMSGSSLRAVRNSGGVLEEIDLGTFV